MAAVWKLSSSSGPIIIRSFEYLKPSSIWSPSLRAKVYSITVSYQNWFQIKRTCTDSFEVNFFMVNHACMTEVGVKKIIWIFFGAFYIIVLYQYWSTKFVGSLFSDQFSEYLHKYFITECNLQIYKCFHSGIFVLCWKIVKCPEKYSPPGSSARSHVLLWRGRMQLCHSNWDNDKSCLHHLPCPYPQLTIAALQLNLGCSAEMKQAAFSKNAKTLKMGKTMWGKVRSPNVTESLVLSSEQPRMLLSS